MSFQAFSATSDLPSRPSHRVRSICRVRRNRPARPHRGKNKSPAWDRRPRGGNPAFPPRHEAPCLKTRCGRCPIGAGPCPGTRPRVRRDTVCGSSQTSAAAPVSRLRPAAYASRPRPPAVPCRRRSAAPQPSSIPGIAALPIRKGPATAYSCESPHYPPHQSSPFP